MTLQDLRYFLVTPTGTGMDPEYCSSLVRTWKHLMGRGLPLPVYLNSVGPEVPNLHALLDECQRSRTAEAGIFWVGADHSWTPESLVLILEAACARPEAVIGGLYPMANGGGFDAEQFAPGALPDGSRSTPDLLPALYLGWGFIWTPFSVFDRLKPPFWRWEIRRSEDGKRAWWGGPDIEFSTACREAGIEVLAHARAADIGHGQRLGHLTAEQLIQRAQR